MKNLNIDRLAANAGQNRHATARCSVLITLAMALCGATKIQAQYQLSPLDYFAAGINDSGTILADDGLGDSLLVNGDSVAINVLPDGVILQSGGINAQGTIIGLAITDDYSSTFAFVLTKQGKDTHLTIPGGSSVLPMGINSSGVVVGTYRARNPDNNRFFTHGFIWDATGPKTFDVPGSSNTYLRGINASGTMVGSYTSIGVAHSFMLAGSKITPLYLPGALQNFANGINSLGQIVGSYTSSANPGLNLGYIYDNGAVTPVGSVFSADQAPLSFQQPFDFGGGVSGTVTWVQSKNFTDVMGINDSGEIFGQCYVDYTVAVIDCDSCGLTPADFGDELTFGYFTGARDGSS